MTMRTIIRALRAFHDAQSGAAVVEFALMVPLLSLLILGIVEFGRFEYDSIIVSNAAHAGAQYGAQGGTSTAADTSGMIAAAQADEQQLPGPVPSPTATSFAACSGTGTAPTCNNATGSYEVTVVQVTASGSFHSLFNYYLLPETFNITSTATMQASQ